VQIKVNEISNGFIVDIENKEGTALVGKTSVYKSTEVLLMLEEIGRVVYGKKVRVQEK
jgi:hypothetical protein